jgi:hypothetical protein
MISVETPKYLQRVNLIRFIKLFPLKKDWCHYCVTKHSNLHFKYYENGEKKRIPILVYLYMLYLRIEHKENTFEFWAKENRMCDFMSSNYIRTGRVMHVDE